MASSLVMARTAPLLAVYASCGVALPSKATTLAVLMMLPFLLLCFRKLMTACLHPNHTPLTLMLCVRSHIFSGVSIASASSPCIMPALLKIMSTPPQESTWDTIAATSSSLDTSHLIVFNCGCLGMIFSIFSVAFSKAGSEISAISTEAPSRRNRIVVSRPIPLHEFSKFSHLDI